MGELDRHDETGEFGAAPFGEAVNGGQLAPHEERLLRLLAEFRRRQRQRPDLVVRPWWTPVPEGSAAPRLGFVLEYCPDGAASVELTVRGNRVTVEGPFGAANVPLSLATGWEIDGVDAGSPETMANHLIRWADQALETVE